MTNTTRKLILAGLIAGILGAAFLVLPGFILAGGPTIPTDPPMPGLHRHFLVLPDGSTQEVGPDWCDNQDNPAIKLAFYNFHYNIHAPGGAPGLHNGQGAEIRGNPGCGPIPSHWPPTG
ncbi:MAG TPA: hypothetical protein VGH92_01470 [Gaiellaceae bacterium]